MRASTARARIPPSRDLTSGTASQAPDLAPQTVACVPKYAALLFRGNLGHLENPCHVKNNQFLLLKRGIHYEEDYGDCSRREA